MWTRRNVSLGLFMLAAAGYSASATAGYDYPLEGDESSRLENFKMPVELDPARLPGVVWKGSDTSDLIIYEFFDYNCRYCRQAGHGLNQISAQVSGLRIGLVNNPILSIGSWQVAKIQQGILRLYGPDRAYAFHSKMLDSHGPATGPSALGVAREMGLDIDKIKENADSSTIANVVRRQAELAMNAGMVMTPSFVIAGTVILGWPGEGSLRGMIAAARKCDHPVCS